MIPKCTNQTHTNHGPECVRVWPGDRGGEWAATTEPLVESCPITAEAELSDGQTAQWAARRRSCGGGFPGPLAAAGGRATPVPSGGGGARAGGGGSGCLTDRGGARSSSLVRAPSQDSRVPGGGRRASRSQGSWCRDVGTLRALRLFHRGGLEVQGLQGARCPRPSYRGQPSSEPGEGRAGSHWVPGRRF